MNRRFFEKYSNNTSAQSKETPSATIQSSWNINKIHCQRAKKNFKYDMEGVSVCESPMHSRIKC